jgi:hypothetical protein
MLANCDWCLRSCPVPNEWNEIQQTVVIQWEMKLKKRRHAWEGLKPSEKI